MFCGGCGNLPALTPNLEDQRVDMVLALSWNKQVGFSYYYVVFGQEKGVDMSIFPRKKWWVKLSSVWKTQFLQFFFACVCGRACVHLDIPGSSKCEKMCLLTRKTYQKADVLHIWKIETFN